MRDKPVEFLCIGKKKLQISFAWDEVSHDTELNIRKFLMLPLVHKRTHMYKLYNLATYQICVSSPQDVHAMAPVTSHYTSKDLPQLSLNTNHYII